MVRDMRTAPSAFLDPQVVPKMDSMPTHLILGTAGHIDHGKTSLVKALTGVDTDRLPDEKRRGITIDLGFAELTLGDIRLGIVDVPGHERFVRNMLAGATGIDVALLVVAADDSIKPQTREHLEILRLLAICEGVIAITKCDLCDSDWIDLVEEEVRKLVVDTFLTRAPIVRTSTHTGAGLDALRDALAAAARRVTAPSTHDRSNGPFRMPIDRTFTIAGHGTVVTGSVAHGSAQVGDELALEPGARRVRVRGLQNHDRAVEQVERGQRAAINLAGVRHDEIHRGQEVASLGHLVPSRLMSVRLHLLPSAARPLKNRSRVRVHVGTAELMAWVVLLDGDRLEPGGWGFAQLYLSEPAVATHAQPLVIRSQSPVETIGGGTVVDPVAPKLRRNDAEPLARLAELGSTDPLERAAAAAYFAGFRPWQPMDLARTAHIDDVEGIVRALEQSGRLRLIVVSPSRALRVETRALEAMAKRIEEALARLHAQFPLQTAIERARLARRFEHLLDTPLLDAVLTLMNADGRLRLTTRDVALRDHGPRLTSREHAVLERLSAIYRDAGCQPPSNDEVKKQFGKDQSRLPELVALAASEGTLVPINADYYLHAEIDARLRQTLREHFAAAAGGLTVSQIRDILGTTRKYAVPLCEYLDRTGFTLRQGDVRTLSSSAP